MLSGPQQLTISVGLESHDIKERLSDWYPSLVVSG